MQPIATCASCFSTTWPAMLLMALSTSQCNVPLASTSVACLNAQHGIQKYGDCKHGSSSHDRRRPAAACRLPGMTSMDGGLFYDQAGVTFVAATSRAWSPNTIWETPPGAASTREEGLSVRKLPTFWPSAQTLLHCQANCLHAAQATRASAGFPGLPLQPPDMSEPSLDLTSMHGIVVLHACVGLQIRHKHFCSQAQGVDVPTLQHLCG